MHHFSPNIFNLTSLLLQVYINKSMRHLKYLVCTSVEQKWKWFDWCQMTLYTQWVTFLMLCQGFGCDLGLLWFDSDIKYNGFLLYNNYFSSSKYCICMFSSLHILTQVLLSLFHILSTGAHAHVFVQRLRGPGHVQAAGGGRPGWAEHQRSSAQSCAAYSCGAAAGVWQWVE